MHRSALLLLGTVLVLLVPVPVPAEDALPFTMAIYNPASQTGGHTWTFEELAAHGFGAFYQQADWTWEWFSPGWHEQRMGTDSVEAASHGLYYVAGGYYHSPPWDMINFTYSRAANEAGIVETLTPSPVDDNYWRYIIEEGAVNLASLSLRYPIWGLVWDIELYNHGAFSPTDYSYDEAALQEFARDARVIVPALPPRSRYGWLRDNGLLGAFQEWEADKVCRMARGTLEKVQAINPDFRLGILYFEERSWWHWALVKGFGSEESPTSAWSEKTYAGFRHGPGDSDETYLEMWADHGIHGQFLPGIAAIQPWKQYAAIEQALRHIGHLWLYQRHYPPEMGPEFDRTFSFVNRYILWNGTGINPLPTFKLHPGIDASPHMGPDGLVSCFFDTYVWKAPPPSSFQIITDAEEIEYSGGFNYTTKTLAGPNPTLKPGDFPCIIYGITRRDLERTETFAVIREVEELLTYHHHLGLGELEAVAGLIAEARADLDAGRLTDARAKAYQARSSAYGGIQGQVWPLVDQAQSNPRESSIPLRLLSVFSNARSMISGEDAAKGESYFYSAMRDWAVSVPEHPWFPASCLMAAAVLALGKARRMPWKART